MKNIRRFCTLVLAFFVVLTATSHAQTGKPDFDAIFNEHGVVMLLIEPGSGKIVDANPAAARFYGYPQDQLRAMSIQEINTFTPEQVAAERKLAESQGRNYFIFRHRLANNEIRTVEVHSRPFDFDGQKLLFSLINDITPGRHEAQELWHYQQRLEETVDAQVRQIERVKQTQLTLMLAGLLVQAIVIAWLIVTIRRRRRLEQERETLLATLEARNQELSRLGEVMAHHFQEPARRLVSFAQRLQGKSALVEDADSRKSIEFIDNQARRLSELVRDAQRYLALDHAKLGSDTATDSGAALQKCIDALGASQPALQINVQKPMPHVRMPEKLLRELFGILLDNALSYRHPERTLRIDVTARSIGKRVTFRFADNGSGIASEYRTQVLGLFTRLVPNSMPGTGMGLALVHKMVGLAGGHLHIEDGIDGGACIVFDLPLET
jgi:two-component system, chemotaxis family, sensor kinase Cph1